MSLFDHCPRRRAVGKTVGGSKSLVDMFRATGGGFRVKKLRIQKGNKARRQKGGEKCANKIE